MTVTQPDLFGETDAADAALAELLARRAAHRATFERPLITLAYDTGIGDKGEQIAGWKCPDCGDVELTEFCLFLNHGWDVGNPDSRPCDWAATPICHRQLDQGRRRGEPFPEHKS